MAKKQHNETIVYLGAGVVMVGVFSLLFMMTGNSRDDFSGPPTVGEPLPVNEAGLYAAPAIAPEPAAIDLEQEKATRPPVR